MAETIIQVTIGDQLRERKLLKIIDRPGKLVQIFPFLGPNLGDSQDMPIGVHKLSIHHPKTGQEEHVIHYKSVKANTADDRMMNSFHHTKALKQYDRFAPLITGRFTRMDKGHNDVMAKPDVNFRIPLDFDPNSMLLIMGVFVGKKTVAFELPPDGPPIQIMRIECADLSLIVLYTIESRFSLENSYYVVSITKPLDVIEPEARAQMERAAMGGTPSYTVDTFLWHCTILMNDYHLKLVSVAEQFAKEGHLSAEDVEIVRGKALQDIAELELWDSQQIAAGRDGRHLQAHAT